MNCDEMRIALRDSFDHGSEHSPELETHLETCPDCSAYALRLEELEQTLFAMPVEEIDPAFVTDLRQAVAEKQSLWLFQPAFLRAAAVVLTVCTVLFGWQYAFILEHATTGWDRLLAWFSIEGVIDVDQSIGATFTSLANWASQSLEPVAGISPSVQWMSVMAAGAAIVLLNGFEFWRLRIAGGRNG